MCSYLLAKHSKWRPLTLVLFEPRRGAASLIARYKEQRQRNIKRGISLRCDILITVPQLVSHFIVNVNLTMVESRDQLFQLRMFCAGLQNYFLSNGDFGKQDENHKG